MKLVHIAAPPNLREILRETYHTAKKSGDEYDPLPYWQKTEGVF